MSKNKPVHRQKVFLWELQKPMEFPKIGNTICPTPASVDLCQGVTQGSGKMKGGAQMIPRSKLLKSGRIIGGA